MEFDDKRECIVFDDDELLPALPDVGWRKSAAKATILCACIVATVVAVCSIGVWMVGTDDMPSEGGSGDGGYQPPTYTEESSLEDDTHENASGDSEGVEKDESRGEESDEPPKGEDSDEETSVDVAVADLSFSEKGDGYIYNYSGSMPDVDGLLDMGFRGGQSYYSERPAVLILHTYIREGYYDLDPDTPAHMLSKSVITVGERIAYELNRRGVPTVHSTVIHGEGADGAYTDAAETIRHMLEIYPTIEYVIDLRRLDDRDGDGRLISTVSASGTAQIKMTVSSNGTYSQDTLALSLAMRRMLNKDGKAICMPVVYTDVALNVGIVPYYIRVDVGSSGNLTSEALEAGKYFAEAFADVLKK